MSEMPPTHQELRNEDYTYVIDEDVNGFYFWLCCFILTTAHMKTYREVKLSRNIKLSTKKVLLHILRRVQIKII
jgi:hypothetical protein